MTLTSHKYKIGFLSLRNIHHLYHIAPIAYELSRDEANEVIIFTSFTRAINLLSKFNQIFPDHNCKIKILQQSWAKNIIAHSVKRRPFPRPKNIIRNNVELFASMDAIVSPDFYSDFLISKFNTEHHLKKPKFIFTFHGAGDGAYGFGKELKLYDFLLLSGEKVQRRLQENNILTEKNWKIIGYPKFDIVNFDNGGLDHLFNNNNPVVLYNPHFKNHLSSWPAWGLNILEEFYQSDKFNLIFSPHITLFEKKQLYREIPFKYFEANNIHIDTGSEQCTDMTYIKTADIYMGDVSSQTYEFIKLPRPCLFLNAHDTDWENNKNYQHWYFGRVIKVFSEIMPAIKSARTEHEVYRQHQEKCFKDTFNIQDNVTSSKRGADAIIEFLDGKIISQPTEAKEKKAFNSLPLHADNKENTTTNDTNNQDLEISCYVLTYNSEKYLSEVLRPLTKLTDDIVILDSGSTDNTKSIAEKFNCRFIYRKFDNFINQRNFAAEQCKHDWIVFVDSDEICDLNLIESLIKIKNDKYSVNGVQLDAIRFKRRWFLFGKEVHSFFPVSSPDYPFRAFRKSKVKFSGTNVHETPTGFSEYIEIQDGSINHYSGESVEYIFQKLNLYTSLAAQDMKTKGTKGSWFNTITHSFAAGIKWYFSKGGWRDGSVGVLLGFYAVYYTFMKYLKLHFSQR